MQRRIGPIRSPGGEVSESGIHLGRAAVLAPGKMMYRRRGAAAVVAAACWVTWKTVDSSSQDHPSISENLHSRPPHTRARASNINTCTAGVSLWSLNVEFPNTKKILQMLILYNIPRARAMAAAAAVCSSTRTGIEFVCTRVYIVLYYIFLPGRCLYVYII